MKNSKILQHILADKEFIEDELYNGDDVIENLIQSYTEHLIKTGQIKLEKMVQDKTFIKKKFVNLDRLRNNYMDYLADSAPALKPKNKSRTNYIGIELECFTRYDRFDLIERITELGLNKIVQADGDGSIEPDFGDDCELRILLPEKQLTTGLKKISKLLTKGKFGVNDTCGLHIHIDMRNRDVNKCYERLIKFQDILFGMVEKERRSNSYCKFATDQNKFDRYVAINKEMAYSQHKTIEIRLHHATLDLKRIEQWIKLLLKVISSTTPPPQETKAAVLKWGKKQKGLGRYIAKNFDDNWFNEKKQRVAVGMGGDWD